MNEPFFFRYHFVFMAQAIFESLQISLEIFGSCSWEYGNEFFFQFFSVLIQESSVAPPRVNCTSYMERFSLFLIYLDCVCCGI